MNDQRQLTDSLLSRPRSMEPRTRPTVRLHRLALMAILAAPVSAQMPHDCVPYDPTATGGALVGSWDAPNETDVYAPAFTIPADPGGGWVEVSLVTTGSGSPTAPSPVLVADNHPDVDGGVILGGSASGSANELERLYRFEVAGGVSYSLAASAFFEPPEYPWGYTINWQFNSRVDCYEPNDSEEEAKSIPLNETIEAFGIAGLVASYLTDDREYDWYQFTLDEPTEVRIETMQVASDQSINLRLFQDSTSALWLYGFPPVGETIRLAPTVLPAGKWLLEVEADPIGRLAVDVHFDEPPHLPDHFETPYRLRVVDLDEPIFADGFETGDLLRWSAAVP